MGIFDEANQSAVLAASARAAWSEREVRAVEGQPPSAGSGFNVQGALYAAVVLACRKRAHARTVTVEVDTYSADNLTTTIDGNAVNTLGASHSDVDTFCRQLADDLNGDATVGALVEATALDANGLDAVVTGDPAEKVEIVGLTTADYTIALATSGSLAVTGWADVAAAEGDLYALPGGELATRPDTWAALVDVVPSADQRNWTRTVDCRLARSIALRVDTLTLPVGDGANVSGRAWVQIGAMRPSEV